MCKSLHVNHIRDEIFGLGRKQWPSFVQVSIPMSCSEKWHGLTCSTVVSGVPSHFRSLDISWMERKLSLYDFRFPGMLHAFMSVRVANGNARKNMAGRSAEWGHLTTPGRISYRCHQGYWTGFSLDVSSEPCRVRHMGSIRGWGRRWWWH